MYQEERVELGAELKRLRKRAKLTGIQVASRTGISQSKISKLEAGLLIPTDEDLERLAKAFAHQGDEWPSIEERVRALRTEYSSWRLAHRAGLASKQREIAALEMSVRHIRLFQVAVVPGLLQTAAYAREILQLANTTGQVDIDQAVARRIERQHLLHDQQRQFEFVIFEPALRSSFCRREVVAAQLDWLLGRLALPNVRIYALPIGVGLPAIPQNSFCIFDNTAVRVETTTAELDVRDPRDIAQYKNLFDRFRSVALADAEVKRFLNELASRP